MNFRIPIAFRDIIIEACIRAEKDNLKFDIIFRCLCCPTIETGE